MVICYLLIANYACTRADVVYIESPKGRVEIYPTSEHILPVVQYHFYNTDGKTEYFQLDSDNNGNFEGTLLTGTYRVIATNTSASHVLFDEMDSYETAIVKAGLSPNTSADYTMLLQPDSVYSVIVENLVVTEGDTVRQEPVPVLLTKHLELVFTMQDGLDTKVVSMTGVLPGIYPAVRLYTRAGAGIDQSPQMAVNFETVVKGDKREAHISLFGVHNDPDYTNSLELNLTMNDGTSSKTTLDLTKALSDAINEGTIPSKLSISVDVTITDDGIIKAAVNVEDWIEEEESEPEGIREG
jgi:hypothetical protein